MKLTKEVKHDGATVVVRSNSNRGLTIKRFYFQALLRAYPHLQNPKNEDVILAEEVIGFVEVAARIESAIGWSFDMPSPTADDAVIKTGFEAYQDDDPTMWTLIKAAINQLDQPIAPIEQRPHEALTEAEKTDPKS